MTMALAIVLGTLFGIGANEVVQSSKPETVLVCHPAQDGAFICKQEEVR